MGDKNPKAAKKQADQKANKAKTETDKKAKAANDKAIAGKKK
jgi:hypothetical protein